ncbi:MAG: hypothetical protein F4Z83_10635 [Gemmatimonadetes bacterium]|nr:hypothetical protein [Gemmatimonadota bacterium]
MTAAVGVVCPQCQYPENPDGANFCARCGGALRGPPCPACSAPSDVGDRFCTQCGEGLSAKRPRVAIPGARSPWTVAGALVLMVVILLVVQQTSISDGPPASPPSPAPFS